jgi:hypothetical protein
VRWGELRRWGDQLGGPAGGAALARRQAGCGEFIGGGGGEIIFSLRAIIRSSGVATDPALGFRFRSQQRPPLSQRRRGVVGTHAGRGHPQRHGTGTGSATAGGNVGAVSGKASEALSLGKRCVRRSCTAGWR